jgi:phospholipase C
MKGAATGLCALFVLGSITAQAQDPTFAQGTVKHMIIVIQENRTPDNLFGGDTSLPTGANIATKNLPVKNSQGQLTTTNLTALPIYTCYDLGHTHQDFELMYDGDAMDGANSDTVLPTQM